MKNFVAYRFDELEKSILDTQDTPFSLQKEDDDEVVCARSDRDFSFTGSFTWICDLSVDHIEDFACSVTEDLLETCTPGMWRLRCYVGRF